MAYRPRRGQLTRQKKPPVELHMKALKGRVGISYIRFSHINQGFGSTIARQEKVLAAVLRESGIELLPEFIDVFIDKGKSAVKAEHRTKGKLALIIKWCKEGRIKPGTVLIVEALDRLIREATAKALKLIVQQLITDFGLVIVTGNDMQVWDRTAVDGPKIHYLLALIQRAYDEGQRQKEKAYGAHDNRRKMMKHYDPNDKKAEMPIVTCPGWVKRTGDRKQLPIVYEEIEQHANTVRHIFDLFCEGTPPRKIALRLNANKKEYPVFGAQSEKEPSWASSRIRYILDDRRVLGFATVYELPAVAGEAQDAAD